MRRTILVAVLGAAMVFSAGCGSSSEEADPQTTAVVALLREELTVREQAERVSSEAKAAQRQAETTCSTPTCIEASATIIEASTQEIEAAADRLEQIQRRINSYPRSAVQAAYGEVQAER